jgi:hypothetical protein
MTEKKNGLEKALDELITDPDSAENSDTREPPQTIDAEPEGDEATPKRN